MPPTMRAGDRRGDGIGDPFDDRRERPEARGDGVRDFVDGVRDAREAELVQPVEQDPAADPQHRRGADGGERLEQPGDHADEEAADRAAAALPRSAMWRPMSSSFTISATAP